MMALTPKRLFLYLCIYISLLRPYTLFSRSPLVKLSMKMRVSSNELFSTLKNLPNPSWEKRSDFEFFDSLAAHNSIEIGDWQDLRRDQAVFRSCNCRSTGADYRPRTWMELPSLRCFVVFFSPVEWPFTTSTKRVHHTKNSLNAPCQGNKLCGLNQCLCQGSNAWLCYSDTGRQKTWLRNKEYSEESEHEEKSG